MGYLVRDIRTSGTTVIITTHYMDEAEVLCDRVAIMDSGKIIALDSPDLLIDNLVATGFERPKEVKKGQPGRCVYPYDGKGMERRVKEFGKLEN